MTTVSGQTGQLSTVKQALLMIEEMRAKLGAIDADKTEPIAVIGVSCRFPGGAKGPDAFWQQLVEGKDAISETPPDRWDAELFYDPDPETPGKIASRWGGFIEKVDQFDAAFFGISPREAQAMDPQQRIMLEVAWEALERAGLSRERIAGSLTGVYIGSVGSDYHQLSMNDCDGLGIYSGTGISQNIIAGRISYLFDLRGPSLLIDTACSSSLVAVHLACQSLRHRECQMALAGGVNLMLVPHGTICASRMRLMASDGRCKTFDARADGFVRGEGCGVVVLKRLRDAVADRDPILAVVRGSAVNQDGQSNGLTAPNVAAQKEVIELALRDGNVSPELVTYVETHGTGTVLGDPIEIEALKAVYGRVRADGDVCALGGVKTNIGHLEGAAGIAGFIKTVLMLRYGMIPPLLHLKNLNPHISFDQTPFVIPTTKQAWSPRTGRRIAGVSSFGWAGTNAHVILEEAPELQSEAAPECERDGAVLVPLSARSEAALKALAQSYSDWLAETPDLDLHDLAFTATHRRTHHDERLAVVGRSSSELKAAIDDFLAGELRPGVNWGHRQGGQVSGVVFVFPGQGGQWLGMGRGLLRENHTFQQEFERCSKAFQPLLGIDLSELLQTYDPSWLDDIALIQPLTCAVQIALAAVWRDWGIHPAAVIGHSMGEVAAAAVAGILTLPDAARVICLRSKLLRRIRGQGAMATVGLNQAEAAAALGDESHLVSVAVSNSPGSTVLAGDPQALDRVIKRLDAKGVFCWWIKVDVASHSPQVEPLLAELRDLLEPITPQVGHSPFLSTVAGKELIGTSLDADYWGRNLRQPVQFGRAIELALQRGLLTFIEISPHQLLKKPVEQVMASLNRSGMALQSLQREVNERSALLDTVARLYVAGYPVAWERVSPPATRQCISLPTYPWQQERFWLEVSNQFPVPSAVLADTRGSDLRTHPLLGNRLLLPSGVEQRLWEAELNKKAAPYLHDHRIRGVAVLPAAAYVEIALSAATQEFGKLECEIDDLQLIRALFLPEDRTTRPRLQIVLTQEAQHEATFEIYSNLPNPWTRHAAGRMGNRSGPFDNAPSQSTLDWVRAQSTRTLDGPALYSELEHLGATIGPQLQSIKQFWQTSTEAVMQLELSDDRFPAVQPHVIHPALLDACFQALALMLVNGADGPTGHFYLPVEVERILLRRSPGRQAHAHVRLSPGASAEAPSIGEIWIYDSSGAICAGLIGIRLEPLEGEDHARDSFRLEDCLYQVEWQPLQHQSAAPTGSSEPEATKNWLVLSDRDGVGDSLAGLLSEQGNQCVVVRIGALFERHDQARFTVNPQRREDLEQLFSSLPSKKLWEIVCLWGIDAPNAEFCEASGSAPTSQTTTSVDVLRLVQSLVLYAVNQHVRLWLVTRGAQSVGGSHQLELSQSPLWGLGHVIATEHHELWGGLIDLDPQASPKDSSAHLIQTISQPEGESRIAYRKGQSYASRLVRVQLARDTPPRFRCRANASYLITGGLGDLGLATARWLVRHGARQLILMSRTRLPPRSQWLSALRTEPYANRIDAVLGLEALGATVHLAAVDVADESQLGAFITTYKQEGWPPIRGVIHTAAVTSDRMLMQLAYTELDDVFRPKIDGSWLLHRCFADTALDFFVLFSSGASLLGQPGQANYAAANSFLDALAHYRRARGLTALSVNWGYWRNMGFAAKAGKQLGDFLARRGASSFAADEALYGLEYMLQHDLTQAALLRVDWMRWLSSGLDRHSSTFLAGMAQSPTTLLASERRDVRSELFAAQTGSGRRKLLESYLIEQTARVLRLSQNRISRQVPLGTLGFDSLVAIELRNRLESELLVKLSATMVWNYPTIPELATYVAERLDLSLDTDREVVTDNQNMAAQSAVLQNEEVSALLREAEILTADELRELLA